MSDKIYRTGIGQDSHRFLKDNTSKPCIIGGVLFENVSGFLANSDGDIIFHAICNAISSLTGVLILGKIADKLCKNDGITDSSIYLKTALKYLKKQKIEHIAISLEGKKPLFIDKIDQMKNSIANVLNIDSKKIGITATSGEGLTEFGLGVGVNCLCIVTTSEEIY